MEERRVPPPVSVRTRASSSFWMSELLELSCLSTTQSNLVASPFHADEFPWIRESSAKVY